MTYRTTEMTIACLFKSHQDNHSAYLAPSIFWEHVMSLDIILGTLDMFQVTSGHGSSNMLLGSERLKEKHHMVSISHEVEPNLSPVEKAKLI
jgi:hypothetical protein